MLKYEICGCERHIEHEEFEGYRKGIVYNSGAPSWEEAIYPNNVLPQFPQHSFRQMSPTSIGGR